MNILIGADLVPTKSNIPLFESGNAMELLGEELVKCLNCADYRIFNLEVPLTDQERPIQKCGPNLIAPRKCIAGYQKMGVDLLTLANNHILDQDQQGLNSTIQTLKRAGIAYTGVGSTREEASKPYVFECDGKTIGVYACAEHEFSIVTEHSAGANPIDLLESPDHVAGLKAQCDYVIVLYHGGKEHYRYPSPSLQKVCRKLVEKGADLVVCQHSHCIGCEEKYLGGTIVYGQGNFLFDYDESEFWQTSLLIQVGNDFETRYLPLRKHGNVIRMVDGIDAAKILSDFSQRSREIQEAGVIEQKFRELTQQCLSGYLCALTGKRLGILVRIINKLSGYRFLDWWMRHRYSTRTLLPIMNNMKCETHRELQISGFIYSINGKW